MKELKIKKQSRAAEYLTGKGFYLTLMISLTLIGFTVWKVMNRSIDKFIDKNVTLAKETVSDESLKAVNKVAYDIPIKDKTPPKKQEVKNNLQAAGELDLSGFCETEDDLLEECFKTQDAQESVIFIAPLFGKVVNEFSNNELVKDKTMSDWRIHGGVDIAAPQGTPVKSVADGEVVRIFDNGMMGQCIEVEHGNNFSSIYCGLNKNVNISEGDQIEAGTIIGSVGDTAIGEAALGPHLHLEILENGERINPLNKITISQ